MTCSVIIAALWLSAPIEAPQSQEASARRAIENGRLDEALAAYEQLSRDFPDSDDYLVWAGRVSRWLGNADGAIRHLDQVLAREPGHTEARIEKAYVRMGQERYREASELLNPLLQNPGGNPDVMIAMARLHRDQGANRRARDYVSQILEVYPDHQDARELERNIATALGSEPRIEATIEYGQDRLALATPAHNTGLTVSYTGDRTRGDLRVEAWDKFGNRSQRFGPAVSHRFGERLWVRGSAMWARDARVLPRQSLGAGASWAFPGGWVASADYRQLRFEDPVIHVVSPSIEYYFERSAWVRVAFYRSWTRHRTTADPDTAQEAFAVQYNHQLGTWVVGFVGYARGNESYSDLSIDRIGSFDANSYTFGGTIRVTDGFSTRTFYSHQQRSTGNDQDSFGVSLTFRR